MLLAECPFLCRTTISQPGVIKMIGFTDYSECSVRQVSNSGINTLFLLLITVNAPQRSGYEYLIIVTLLITVNIDEKAFIVY